LIPLHIKAYQKIATLVGSRQAPVHAAHLAALGQQTDLSAAFSFRCHHASRPASAVAKKC